LVLVGRITLASKPFEGWSSALALGSGALAGLAVWTLASAVWSDAPARALAEFDRTLLYGLVLVLTGSAAARIGDLSMLLRWAAAAFAAIALAGLLTRLLPDTFTIGAQFLPERVSFPLTYWNAMGIACAVGALLTLHLTSSGDEPRGVQVVAAAMLAPIAVTLYLTFSRGAIWVLPIGFVLYAVLAQPRGLVSGLLAGGIPAAIATKIAYGNELLARADYDSSAAAASQGRHVALVVLLCALAAAGLRYAARPLDRWLGGWVHPAGDAVGDGSLEDLVDESAQLVVGERVLDQWCQLPAQGSDDQRDLGDAEGLGQLRVGSDVDGGEEEPTLELVGQPRQ